MPALHDLAVAAYAHHVARIGARPGPMDSDYAALVRAGQVWVADGAGEVVGLVVLREEDDHVLVENVAVAPPWQGRGVG